MKMESQLIQKTSFAVIFLLIVGVVVVSAPLPADTAETAPNGAQPGEENGAIRRDPFVNPLVDHDPTGVTIGPEDMRIDEVGLIGVAELQKERVAIVLGTDNRGYTLRKGDRLKDGELVRIDTKAGEAVFLRDLPGPHIPTRSLEVTKKLHVG